MELQGARRVLWLVAALAAISGCGQSEQGPAPSGTAEAAEGALAKSPVADPPAGGTPTQDPSTVFGASSTDSGPVTFLAAAHDVQVFARVDGIVTQLDVEEGFHVGAGGRLAQLEDESQRLTLQEREAELVSAQSAFDRSKRLYEEKMLSEQQYLDARAGCDIARARRDRAKLDLEHCAVRTPIRGLVSMRMVQVGQMVKEGDLMFRVSDPDTLRAELLLPEEQLGQVRVGQPVLLVPRVGGARARARVTRINPVVDAASGTFRVVIDLDNRTVRLPAGISVRCQFEPLQSVQRRR